MQFASHDLQNDADIVLVAVRNDGMALQYASAVLQGEANIVNVAVRQDRGCCALQYASHDLQNDAGVVLAGVRNNGYALMYASAELQDDHAIVLAAVAGGYPLPLVSWRFRGDRQIVLAAVQYDGMALWYAPPEFRCDRYIVVAALYERCRSKRCRHRDGRRTKLSPSVIDEHILQQTMPSCTEAQHHGHGVRSVFEYVDKKLQRELLTTARLQKRRRGNARSMGSARSGNQRDEDSAAEWYFKMLPRCVRRLAS